MHAPMEVQTLTSTVVPPSHKRLRFSLLLATVQRVAEVKLFLQSMVSQTYRDFEILVIDQNSDDRLLEIVNEFKTEIPLRHLRCGRGLSKARNFGLKHATGDVIAMPDDDCWYSNDLLEIVAAQLEANKEWSGVTGRSITQDGKTSAGRWDPSGGELDRHNAWRRAISYTIFIRRSALRDHTFDESLGVGAGTAWGAGEETDLLLRLLAEGNKMVYDPDLTVHHPQWHSVPYTDTARDKARSYGRGMGRVMRIHKFPAHEVGYHLARPLAGALLALLVTRWRKAAFHWAIFQGRLQGWLDVPSSTFPEPAMGTSSPADQA